MDTNLILTIVQIIAVSIVPLLVWWMGVRWQKRNAKDEAKRTLFFVLMANRKATPNKEWVDALNTIDIVFQDDKKVRKAWREYYDSLDERSQYYQERNSFKLDLLSEMANALGYKDLKQTEIDRFYSPNYFLQLQQTQNLLAQESLRVLSHSKSNAVAFTEEEYQEHKKKLGLKDE
jgi:DNA mismatch repair ATPase MutS